MESEIEREKRVSWRRRQKDGFDKTNTPTHPFHKAFVNNLKTFVAHLGTKVETFFVPSIICATWWMDM